MCPLASGLDVSMTYHSTATPMTASTTCVQRRPPPQRLAQALLCALSCVAAAPASAAPRPDTQWIRIRNDAQRRIFATLPLPRSHAPQPGSTATLPVNNCNDDGPGSLRAAVTAAVSGDEIDLRQLQCSTITLATGAIEVDVDDLALLGPGRDRLRIDGAALDRVLIHPHGGKLGIRGLTIHNGRDRATGFDVAGGGCIASAGYVDITDSTLRNCYAGGEGSYGGALYAYSLTMSNSTLSGNHAYGIHDAAGTAAFGGAAFVYSLYLASSTVSGNRANHRVNAGFTSYDIGGAIVAVTGGTIRESTIDSNSSGGRAGGIASFNPLTVINSTISGNRAQSDIAGGLFLRWPSTLAMDNSTVTANQSALDGGGIWLNMPGSQIRSSIVFGNSSDIGNTDNRYGLAAAFAIDGATSIIGSASGLISLPIDTLGSDPLLRPLAANGGPTRTHALGAGSPAIDAGSNPATLANDQRGVGFVRVHGSAADIGAFEVQPLAPTAAAAVPAGSRLSILLGAALLALAGLHRRRRRRN